MSRAALATALVLALVLLAGTSAALNNDTRDAQAQADDAAAAPAEVRAQLLAEHLAEAGRP